jgi:ABC-2 type transport system ATP-binding protein
VTATDLVVDVRGLSKWFGEATVLDDVDMAVRPGTVHGLLGPNGAGKTTLLSTLFGLVLPGEGTVRLFGRTRQEAGAHWLDGVGGFVESPRFYPYLSGRRNLATLAALDGSTADASVVDGLLDMVGLTGAAEQKVKGYSLGMRQRLGLAAALLRRPRLLILDEPTNGMDPAAIRDLRRALRDLARRGLTVILASHAMGQVEEVCDSATVLHRGRVAFSGGLDRMRSEAPDPTWRLATSDDDAALALANRPGPWSVKTTVLPAEGLSVIAAQEDHDGYVVALGRAGVAVRSLLLDVTPLESMFFQLTEGAGP